jgi:predicted nucleic acid binding AN1-type Zn finger protein
MTVIQLKEKIIAKISSTDNEDLLEHISDLIDFEYNEVHQMSPGEIDAVKDGLEQLKNGQKISHEEVKRQTDEWLKK